MEWEGSRDHDGHEDRDRDVYEGDADYDHQFSAHSTSNATEYNHDYHQGGETRDPDQELSPAEERPEERPITDEKSLGEQKAACEHTDETLQTLSQEQDETTQAMNAEVFATWVGIVLILCVLGAQFSGRETISSPMRKAVDAISIGISVYVMIWAALAYFNEIGKPVSQKMLFVAVVLIVLLLMTFLILTCTAQLG